ncbi:nucleolar and coiled-body phosphoprotein 1 [Platysternon megacephalum]|uniref:Nucleolar and coiled-body phosphoprotein 1 n=1 Tax=Platysternon megacephalum TaxID=55544 RepID=A0A4D9E3N0_9SAUR|nr:nucleolar and coiled-body phosphoprotein 1 [Platysternon megacephalum]
MTHAARGRGSTCLPSRAWWDIHSLQPWDRAGCAVNTSPQLSGLSTPNSLHGQAPEPGGQHQSQAEPAGSLSQQEMTLRVPPATKEWWERSPGIYPTPILPALHRGLAPPAPHRTHYGPDLHFWGSRLCPVGDCWAGPSV